MTSKKFALVKWLDHDDAGKYTVGVPISWILDFDEANSRNNKPDAIYTVKWQVAIGYNYRKAIVVEVSKNKSKLQRLVQAIGGTISKKKCIPVEITQSGKRTATVSLSDESASDSSGDDEIQEQKSKKKKAKIDVPKSFEKANVKNYINKAILDAIMNNQKMIAELNKNVLEIKEILKHIELASKGESICKKSCCTPEPSTTVQSNMVEIGKPGSNVFVTSRQWSDAESKATFTNMALSLLTSVFPMIVLLESNLKGGTSKITPKNAAVPQRKPLDAKKLSAIMDAVRKRFPSEYNDTILRIAINNKLVSLRSRMASKLNEDKVEESNESKACESDDTVDWSKVILKIETEDNPIE